MVYTTNKETEIKPLTLANKFKSGKEQLVGIAYTSDEFPNGILCEPYIESLEFEKDSMFNFTSRIFMHDNNKLDMKYFNSKIEESGLGFVRMEQGEAGITQRAGLTTDLLLKDTILSSVKKIDFKSTFIEPTITYQTIKIQEYVFNIYKVTETINNFTHTVYLMLTKRLYDGQTLLGMLEGKEFNKPQTLQLIKLLAGDKLINKEIAGAFMEEKDVRYSLYNTHETGVFVVVNGDKVSIACGQSFINFDIDSMVSSTIERVSVDKYKFKITLKNNKKLDIFI